MKYRELLNLFNENVKEDTEIDDILKGSETVKGLFPQQPITLDMVKDFTTNDPAGKQFLESYGDKRVSQGLETFKSKTMPTLINDAVLKATGKKKTPEELKYEELERQFNEEKAIRIKTENTNKLMSALTEAGLDAKKTMEFFNVDNLENLDKSIGNFKALIDEGIKAGVKEQISAGNYTPPGASDDGIPSVEDIAKMMM